ncbi:M16 family metallopeptidase [Nafulsella turpanensis]|uniref:M16 family metallopeptidase n=1 Tax=Nafulsella turpanensis TaxID=1265690 RepID=UPI00034CE1A6|nr:pitrilysin family protein [Nafulsella turpanensis]
MLDRRTPPAYQQVTDIKLQNAKQRHLPKGVPLHIINAGKQEVIRIEIVFRAGNVMEEKSAQAFFTTKMLSEGTAKYSAKEIANILDSYGVHLDLSPGFDFCTLSLYSLTKHIPLLLPVLKSVITEPVFPEKELDSLKDIKTQKLRVDNNKNSVVASKLFRSKLFQNHPYGNFLNEEDIAAITVPDLETFFNRHLRNNFEVMVAGAVDTAIEEVITATFADISFKGIQEESAKEVSFPAPERENIPKKGSLQSSIRAGKPLFTLNHPDFNRFSVLNTIFGGYFGSRLMKSIREEKGYTYGIYSSVVPMKSAGYLVIGADVVGEFTEQTLDEIYHQMALLRNELIDAEELETVKNYMLGSFLSSLNTPFALADRYKSVYLHQLGLEYYDAFIKDINEVTAEELQQLAKKYLQQDLTTVVVGNV